MNADEKAQKIFRAMANKYVVRVWWQGTWHDLHSCYADKQNLHTIIDLYIIPDYYQIERGNREQYSLGGLKLYEIKKALDDKKPVRVWNDGVEYRAAGYESGSITKILVRRSVVADLYQIQKCTEHPPCASGHCHEAGCEFYEKECKEVLEEMDRDRLSEMEAERRSEEILYGYELPRNY